MEIKDISQAFLSHLQWKSRLRAFIEGEEEFDIAEISPEGCALGKWLSSDEIEQYASNSRFEELVEAHNELHETAKRVYDLKVMGRDTAARRELSNIVKSSMKIYSLLTTVHIITESENLVLSKAL